MTNEFVIAEWQKNSREILRVRLDIFKGEPVICCRAWYRDASGILQPGRGGLTVSTRHLPAILIAMSDALKAAYDKGYLARPKP
jgi:hypothetical protein